MSEFLGIFNCTSYRLITNKQQSMDISPYATTLSKIPNKNSPEERSKTPNKNPDQKTPQRTSKSLAKRQQKSQGFFNMGARMQPIKEWCEQTRYYYLGRGNNHEAVKRALSQRKNIAESQNSQGIFFKWTQNSFGFKYHRLGKDCLSFNHFEFHREITNKQRLVWNMLNFCQSNKLNAFSYLPTTFIIDLTTGEEDLALHSFLKFYNRNLPEGYSGPKAESILLPKSKYTPYFSAQQLRKRSQGNFYCKPTCPKTFFGKTNSYLWILKPTFMNRGRGVALFSNLAEFQKLIWQYYDGEGLEDYSEKQGIAELYPMQQPELEDTSTNSEPKSETTLVEKPSLTEKPSVSQKSVGEKTSEIKWKQQKEEKGNQLRVLSFIVQKYIECPMLINQRKFDIRVWALLTQNYEVFFFREGYLRFSSHKYSTGDHKNPFIHLTNNSVQKHCNQYDEESGNQISLTDMREYLPDEPTNAKIQAKIREIIWLSLCSARRKINVNARKDCFELFGYDFMVDETYKTWLIEVNTNPAIEECSAVLKALIPRMLDDMFALTIDKIFNLKRKDNPEVYPVKGFTDSENMWELLGDFREGVNEKTMGKKLTLVRR